MRLHTHRVAASAIRTTALLALATAAIAIAPTAAHAGGPQPYCASSTYDGQGSVDCTNDYVQEFRSWSETGATSVYENTPIELGFYCNIGSPVEVILNTTIGTPAWYGTCE